MGDKKKVVVYGNCHTTVFSKYLQNCKEFNDEYIIFPMKAIQEVKDCTYFDMPIFKTCDVFIHQSIRDNNRYGKEYASSTLIAKLKPDCKVISIPNVYHLPTCLFPQYTEDTELCYKGGTFFFRDRVIDEQIKEGRSLQYIINGYHNYTFEKNQIKKQFQKFIENVKYREEEWDIKISDYIQNYYRTHNLFYDPNHPRNFLLRYYAKKTLEILLDRKFTIDELEDFTLDSYEMPLHASVAVALELKYFTIQQEIRKTGAKVVIGPMYLEQYIKQYFSMLWLCNDFSVLINMKSRCLFRYYKVVNFCKRGIRKIIKIFGGNKK